MSSTKLILSLLLIIFLQINTISSTDPLFHICSTSESNFTSSSPYQSKLTNLLKLLTAAKSTLSTTGFATATVGRHSADPVYGLALCRGDVSSSDCQSCAVNATHDIRELCPNNAAAVVWYDNCLLKYSDDNFFGKIDVSNKFYMWNVQSVSSPKLFNEKTKELLGKLSKQAVKGYSKLFATGERQLDTFTRLYGLVQCTRDLTNNDCKKCLDDAIEELPNCCDGKQGGRVVGGSSMYKL
ncbi:hypothetical protein V2J09_001600 [Rumex salicifolius]